ncbi:MAG: sel1 repeat family protein [Rhodospirillales bacterium]|nr:sel1 repeat family protein [Alphaproteobacteria bacterium]MCB1839248.1 sel1 repeat family protein [Alphaproteobacteria bacterium]MCB9976189.1 sel1 repeat family protein [Rhodospirillales bacterium]
MTRRRAFHMLRRGRNLKGLFKLIKPYIKEKDPDALYIYACISLPEWGETEHSFFERRYKYLRFAARAGNIEAIYEIGLVLHTGHGGIEQDKRKAAEHFKMAAEKGHPMSKLYYGLDLFYGSCGIQKDEVLGISFVHQAVDDGVPDARYTLNKLLKLREIEQTSQ